MIMHVCDVCGEPVDEGEAVCGKVDWWMHGKTDAGIYNGGGSYELCSKCTEEFEEMFDNWRDGKENKYDSMRTR